MTVHKSLHFKEDIDDMRQERKEEEDSPKLKIASMYRYVDSNITSKRAKKGYLQPPETTDQQNSNHWKT